MTDSDPTVRRENSDPPGGYSSEPPCGTVERADGPVVVDNHVARRIADLWDSPPDPNPRARHLEDDTTATTTRMAGLPGSAATEIGGKNRQEPGGLTNTSSSEVGDNASSQAIASSCGSELEVHSLLAAVTNVGQLDASGPLMGCDNSGAVLVDEWGASAELNVDDWAVVLKGNNNDGARQPAGGPVARVVECADQSANVCHDDDSTEIAANPHPTRNSGGKAGLPSGVSMAKGAGTATNVYET